MRGGTDIHSYSKRLESALRGLGEAPISAEDRLSIVGFSEVLRSEGLSLGRVAKYVYHVKTMAEKLNESGTTLGEADVVLRQDSPRKLHGEPLYCELR